VYFPTLSLRFIGREIVVHSWVHKAMNGATARINKIFFVELLLMRISNLGWVIQSRARHLKQYLLLFMSNMFVSYCRSYFTGPLTAMLNYLLFLNVYNLARSSEIVAETHFLLTTAWKSSSCGVTMFPSFQNAEASSPHNRKTGHLLTLFTFPYNLLHA
jgi:hypothetical protein